MTEINAPTYAALITITLPGQNESATITVTIAPDDTVPLDGRFVPLRDCTLADLEAYAAALEADVWDTYDEITLLDLNASEQVEVSVSLAEEPEAAVADWSNHMLVLPPMVQTDTDTENKSESDEPTFIADESVLADGTDEAVEEQEPVEPETQETLPEGEQTPAVNVAEAELVFPEIEEDASSKEVPVAAPEEKQDSPIQRSKARVRVAGEILPSGNPTWAAADVLMDEPALRASQAHALSSLNREVAGFLIGPRPEKQPDGRYVVHIIDTIVAKHTVMQGASVTYTPESWRNAHDTLAERYPDETAVMVGWYHTHPGFGIFLSGMDLFIHQTFYTQIWHVAFVLDPRARTSGFFGWDRAKSRVSRLDFAWPRWALGSW